MTSRSPSAKQLLVGVLGVLALLASSCGGSSAATEDSVSSAADATSTAAPVGDDAASTAAPAEENAGEQSEDETANAPASLVASTVAGGQIDFGSLAGQDVVLWFWAPW